MTRCKIPKCKAAGPKWKVVFRSPGKDNYQEWRCDKHLLVDLIQAPRHIVLVQADHYPDTDLLEKLLDKTGLPSRYLEPRLLP